ncbi:MAG TPA: HAD-IA family hydrolase [Polyangiaceae bacterium]|nr:HAD-IA family hydrolase [Polyangiaceae bacterium]
MKLRAPVTHVIFDMDGVLLDTEPVYTEVTNEVAQEYGKTFDWSVKGDMIGRPAMDSAEYIVKALDLPIRPEDYLAKRKARLEALLAKVGRMPGAEAFTRELFRRQIPMAVATSTDRRLFGVKTELHREWFTIFSPIICGDDTRITKGKPAPDIFLVAARDLHVSPSSCVVFEDSPLGLAAGLAAGMRVVAIPDPHMDRRRYAGADFIIDGFAECSPGDLGF